MAKLSKDCKSLSKPSSAVYIQLSFFLNHSPQKQHCGCFYYSLLAFNEDKKCSICYKHHVYCNSSFIVPPTNGPCDNRTLASCDSYKKQKHAAHCKYWPRGICLIRCFAFQLYLLLYFKDGGTKRVEVLYGLIILSATEYCNVDKTKLKHKYCGNEMD